MTTETQDPQPSPAEQSTGTPGSPAFTPAPQGTAPLAVVGLVLAFLLPLIGAALSFIALGQTGPGKRGGRGLAIAGAVIGSLLTVGGIVVAVVSFAVAGAAVDAAVDAADEAVTEFEQELTQLDQDLATAFQDKAGVAAGEIPDFSGDFALGGYTANEFGGALGVTMVNSGDVAYSYTATIAAVSADGATQYDTTVVFVDELAPGQTAGQEGVFFTEIPADARFELVDYSRASF